MGPAVLVEMYSLYKRACCMTACNEITVRNSFKYKRFDNNAAVLRQKLQSTHSSRVVSLLYADAWADQQSDGLLCSGVGVGGSTLFVLCLIYAHKMP